jgi:hypothetical protein
MMTFIDINDDASVIPSDSVLSPAAAPAKRAAVAVTKPSFNVAHAAAKVPPATMPPYDRVPIYHKQSGNIRAYKYFPENLITGDQIRVHVTPNKKCFACGETKNSTNFHIVRRNVDGLYSYCVECVKIRTR